MDAVFIDSGAKDDFSILGSDGFATLKEGHVHELTEQARQWNLAANCGSFRNNGTYEGLQPGEVGGGRDTGYGEAEATIGQVEGLNEEGALRGIDKGGDLRFQWKQFNQS